MTTWADKMIRQNQKLMAEINQLKKELAERDRKFALVDWLTEPYLGQPGGYQHYAINLTDGVHFVVLVDDLRAAMAGSAEARP